VQVPLRTEELRWSGNGPGVSVDGGRGQGGLAMTKLSIGLIVGFLLGSATAGLACGMWKLTIEDYVSLSNGKQINVTCTAWIHDVYLATQKSCEAFE